MSNIPTSQSVAVESAPSAQPVVTGDPSRVMKTDVEPTFTMYRAENKLPFTADYIEAKLTWDEAEMVDDVMAIEDYLKGLVMTGEIADSVKAAKEKLKKIEKMAGIDQLESRAQRLIKLSEFVKFLQNTEKRKNDIF